VEIALTPEPPVLPKPAEPVVERKAPGRHSFEIDLSTTLAELNAAAPGGSIAPNRPEQAPPSSGLSPQAPMAAGRSETPPSAGRAEPVPVAPSPQASAPPPAAPVPHVVEPSRPAGAVDEVKQAAELFERAQEHLRNGAQSEAAAALRTAARVPQWRFKAAAQLGQISASRGDLRGAVEWLERAAEAPSPSVDEGFAVIYDLADALDRIGEPVRALALFMELEGDAGAYRDVVARIDALTARAAGPSPRLGDRR
jgi:tetratricopeptide (TPR) repeat protein